MIVRETLHLKATTAGSRPTLASRFRAAAHRAHPTVPERCNWFQQKLQSECGKCLFSQFERVFALLTVTCQFRPLTTAPASRSEQQQATVSQRLKYSAAPGYLDHADCVKASNTAKLSALHTSAQRLSATSRAHHVPAHGVYGAACAGGGRRVVAR